MRFFRGSADFRFFMLNLGHFLDLFKSEEKFFLEGGGGHRHMLHVSMP